MLRWCGPSGTILQIFCRKVKELYAVPKVTKPAIAMVAEKTPDLSRFVVVVNNKLFFFSAYHTVLIAGNPILKVGIRN
jgi:hypothetical protein